MVWREEWTRVEVNDARVDRLPLVSAAPDEDGCALLLVEALARKRGVELRPGVVYKTVWADVQVGPCTYTEPS